MGWTNILVHRYIFSQGVAILIKSKLHIKIANVEIDDDGRYIIMDIEIDELHVKLVNI